MSDRWILLLALTTAAGALVARPLPLPLSAAIAAVAIAFLVRSPAAVCIGAALLASALGARAWAGLDPPAPARWSGTAVLAGDPAPVNGAMRVEVRLGRRRAEAWARGSPAVQLAPALAGERVWISGTLRPVRGRARSYLAHRHIAARLTVIAVGERRPGPPPIRLANGIRRTIMRGADVLPGQQRALFAGFVLGDQRGESDETKDDFRASGLSHLLVVSGENVAFVLALVQPALRRLRLAPRFLVAASVLALFGLLTRGEPSVLRAEAMAGCAVLAATLGRPVSTQRLLCLAVTGLLLIDPLLIGAVGFLLSVGATAGIAWLTPMLHRRLPLAVAVTVAAQVGVAPLLIPIFGGLPLVSLPANLLAIPAAGPVMMWGIAAGLPAGLLGPAAATVMHVPTRLLVGWVALVADRAAATPLGQLRAPHLLGLIAGVAFARVGWRIASTRAPRSRSP
jgi:competence protein ComEC